MPACQATKVRELVGGHRQGPFVVFEDEDGVRHAVRQGAIMSISEASAEPGATLIQLSGQRTALVRGSFEQVLSWFA